MLKSLILDTVAGENTVTPMLFTFFPDRKFLWQFFLNIQILYYELWKILVFLLQAYIKEKLIQKIVEVKSPKKAPPGNNGTK